MIGAEPEVAADAAALLLVEGGLAAQHPGQRVLEEAQSRHEADHEEQVAEQKGDVVLTGVRDVLVAGEVDPVAQPPAEVEADDPKHDPGEQVEADHAAQWRAGGPFGVHPALLCGAGL